jgi:hypothetical protein
VWRTALLASVLAACDFQLPSAHAVPDGPPDMAPPDMPDADPAKCFGSGAFTVCLPQLPTQTVSLGALALDTDPAACDLGTVIDDGTQPLCVIAGTSVTITGTLRAHGALPLVLIATAGDLHVQGGIDVGSRAGSPGAGASFGGCTAPGSGVTSAQGGGGGAGGSFGTTGGNGGSGGGGGGGLALAPTGAAFVRGGCAGARGGAGNNGSGGAAGAGGGAVYLIARAALAIDGVIDASGEGGGGAASGKNGGGGAGSGGLIALYANTAITIAPSAQLFSNGGGGGGGADSNTGGTQGGEATTAAIGGLGGIGGGTGTSGGLGASGAGGGTSALPSSRGGGGGGGGVGVIKNVSGQTIVTGIFSPDPS